MHMTVLHSEWDRQRRDYTDPWSGIKGEVLGTHMHWVHEIAQGVLLGRNNALR